MNLRLIREPSREGATLGILLADGRWECWTVEDVIREIPGRPVEEWKIPKQTAIPEGRYKLTLSLSQRFGVVLPLLEGVPGFSGVRIHPGNTAADTEGCVLPGTGRTAYTVTGSRVACERLFEKLAASPFEQWITIENPAA